MDDVNPLVAVRLRVAAATTVVVAETSLVAAIAAAEFAQFESFAVATAAAEMVATAVVPVEILLEHLSKHHPFKIQLLNQALKFL